MACLPGRLVRSFRPIILVMEALRVNGRFSGRGFQFPVHLNSGALMDSIVIVIVALVRHRTNLEHLAGGHYRPTFLRGVLNKGDKSNAAAAISCDEFPVSLRQ